MGKEFEIIDSIAFRAVSNKFDTFNREHYPPLSVGEEIRVLREANATLKKELVEVLSAQKFSPMPLMFKKRRNS